MTEISMSTRLRKPPAEHRSSLLPQQDSEDAEAAPYRGPYAKTFDQRRSHILATAWEMIAARGTDFRLSDLSQRSGVALGTIYNAFTDKNGVIAEAVARHRNSLCEGIEVGENQSHRLAEAVEIYTRIAVDTTKMPNLSEASARMYFSSRTHHKVVGSLRRMPISTLRAWIRSDESDRELIQSFGQESIERAFANAQWSLLNDWCANRIDNHELSRDMRANMIAIGLAFGNHVGRAEAKRLTQLCSSQQS